MKRFIKSVGSILGIFALITLIIFAFIVLKPQASLSSPQLSGQQAYPPPENPTWFDIFTQGTGVPYPPPVRPTASLRPKGMEEPTLVPTLKPSPMPTQTPVILPSQGGSLPPGLKMVYGETEGASGTTTIWLVNVKDIFSDRKLLATVDHKIGHEVRGKVSPDGNKIAFIVVPSEASEISAHTNGSELWVMNLDGSESRMAANQVGYMGMWSPDSKAIIVGRWIPIEDNGSPASGWRKEIYLVDTDRSEMKMLVADEKSSDIQPVGWSSSGQVFYYVVRATITSAWELWAADISNNSTHFQVSSPFETNDTPVLSPDGNWLLFMVIKDGQPTLIILSIDGKQQKIITQEIMNDESASQLTGMWSANSQSVLFYIPSETGQQSNLEIVSLGTMKKQSFPITTALGRIENYLTLIGWSPDEKWAMMRESPTQPQSTLYIIKFDSGEITKIPLSLPSNWLIPFGWINQ